MRTFPILAAAAACLALSTTAHATLIAYDGFEGYTSGAALQSNSGGSGWATNWSSAGTVLTVSPSTPLTYTSGAITLSGGSRAAQVSTTGTTDNVASRSFANQTGTVYFSFLFRIETGAGSDDFIQFSLNNDTDISNSGSIGDLSNVGGANTFSARIGALSGGSTAQSTTSAVGATTFLLVGKISKTTEGNYNKMSLFVNPSTLTEPGVVSASQSADAGFAAFSFFTVRVSNLESTDQYRFDELRIGDTWADVVTASAPIPEPSAWATLTGAAALSTGLLRRRRI